MFCNEDVSGFRKETLKNEMLRLSGRVHDYGV